MSKQEYPYIATIEEIYHASTGNCLGREKGKDFNTHPYEWPIFIPKEFAEQITTLPIYGILIKDRNTAFNNGERITCRVLRYSLEELQLITNIDNVILFNQIDAQFLVALGFKYDGIDNLYRMHTFTINLEYAIDSISMSDSISTNETFNTSFSIYEVEKFNNYLKKRIGLLKA